MGQGEFGTVRRLERRCTGRAGREVDCRATGICRICRPAEAAAEICNPSGSAGSPFQTELVAAGTFAQAAFERSFALADDRRGASSSTSASSFFTGMGRGEGLHRQANAAAARDRPTGL